MQLDRHDIPPLAVIVIFGFAIPLAVWIGLSTRQQFLRDIQNTALAYAAIVLIAAIVLGLFAVRARKREQRLLVERGEQTTGEFAALFTSEAERQAATLLLPRLRSMTATGRVPKLERDSELSGSPLYLGREDLAEELVQLCSDLDICTALNRDNEARLLGSATVAQLVSALATFIDEQGVRTTRSTQTRQ